MPSAEGKRACAEPRDWPDNPEKFKELYDSDCVWDGGTIFGKALRITGDNVHVFNLDVDGNGVDKNAVTISADNVVIQNARAGRVIGNDKHAYTVSQGNGPVWIVDSVGYFCSGDGFQAGHQAQSNPPGPIYMVGGDYSGCRENAIDLKWVDGFVAYRVKGSGFRSAPSDTVWCLPDDSSKCSEQNSGSDGVAVVIGSDGDPSNWEFHSNEFSDSQGCFRVEASATSGIIQGNTCTDIIGASLKLDKNSGRITFADNTLTNVGRGVYQNWRTNFDGVDIVRNTFDVTGNDIEYESGSVCGKGTIVDNVFVDGAAVICGNNVQTTEAGINSLAGASGNTVQ